MPYGASLHDYLYFLDIMLLDLGLHREARLESLPVEYRSLMDIEFKGVAPRCCQILLAWNFR
jgi:hypothetical protein